MSKVIAAGRRKGNTVLLALALALAGSAPAWAGEGLIGERCLNLSDPPRSDSARV